MRIFVTWGMCNFNICGSTVCVNIKLTTTTHTQATVIVWRRYGSNGDITVTGMAMVAPSNSLPTNQEAAAEGTDFPVVSVSTTIPDGSTTGELKVPLMDNNLAGPVKVFQFTLTPFSGSKLFLPLVFSLGSREPWWLMRSLFVTRTSLYCLRG